MFSKTEIKAYEIHGKGEEAHRYHRQLLYAAGKCRRLRLRLFPTPTKRSPLPRFQLPKWAAGASLETPGSTTKRPRLVCDLSAGGEGGGGGREALERRKPPSPPPGRAQPCAACPRPGSASSFIPSPSRLPAFLTGTRSLTHSLACLPACLPSFPLTGTSCARAQSGGLRGCRCRRSKVPGEWFRATGCVLSSFEASPRAGERASG